MADEQDVTKNRSWMTPTTVALLSPLSIHPLLLFFRHSGKSPRQTLRNMIVGLGVAGVHAAFMGFLWLQIDVAVPVMEANTLDSQIEREKARASAGIGMFGAAAKGRWQQREEEQGKQEEVSMAQALARMERR